MAKTNRLGITGVTAALANDAALGETISCDGQVKRPRDGHVHVKQVLRAVACAVSTKGALALGKVNRWITAVALLNDLFRAMLQTGAAAGAFIQEIIEAFKPGKMNVGIRWLQPGCPKQRAPLQIDWHDLGSLFSRRYTPGGPNII